MKIVAAWALGASLMTGAFAQSEPVYGTGRSVKDQGITLKGWGSGLIRETDETAYEGTFSIRISARNFFQGGRLILEKPVDLSAMKSDSDNMLMIALKVVDQLSGGGGAGGTGRPGVGSASGGGGRPGPGGSPSGGGGRPGEGGGGMGQPGGGPGGPPGGPPPGPGGRGQGTGSSGAVTAASEGIKQLRMIVTTTDGLKSEIYFPIQATKGTTGWDKVGVPLKAINGFERTNQIVKEVAFSSDSTGTFYVGEIAVSSDSTPITGDVPTMEYNLALGDTAEFTAQGYAGASRLRYTWDFDSTDGIQVDAEGQTIQRKFRKPGEFTVTVTISDAYGLKKPFTSTIKVTVNP
ncbi:MAG: PKD domain-containing protein [Armatimonadetes bacterium]|nr:PKD domain-containing protein [Armatimonadota bacterium]